MQEIEILQWWNEGMAASQHTCTNLAFKSLISSRGNEFEQERLTKRRVEMVVTKWVLEKDEIEEEEFENHTCSLSLEESNRD